MGVAIPKSAASGKTSAKIPNRKNAMPPQLKVFAAVASEMFRIASGGSPRRAAHKPNAAPAAILLEHQNLSAGDKRELVQLLRRHGYSVDDCGGDFFAVHKKSPLYKFARDWAFRARR